MILTGQEKRRRQAAALSRRRQPDNGRIVRYRRSFRMAANSGCPTGGEPMAKILESLQNTVIAGFVLTVIVAIILASI
jgi:hypothetical protein